MRKIRLFVRGKPQVCQILSSASPASAFIMTRASDRYPRTPFWLTSGSPTVRQQIGSVASNTFQRSRFAADAFAQSEQTMSEI